MAPAFLSSRADRRAHPAARENVGLNCPVSVARGFHAMSEEIQSISSRSEIASASGNAEML